MSEQREKNHVSVLEDNLAIALHCIAPCKLASWQHKRTHIQLVGAAAHCDKVQTLGLTFVCTFSLLYRHKTAIEERERTERREQATHTPRAA